MSWRVNGVGSPTSGAPSPATSAIGLAAKTKESAADIKTKQMAQEFEAMFVRQILTSAKIGGASKSGGSSGGGAAGGYQQMGVDALATAITKSGGMGLAKQIEDIVRQTEHRAATSPPMTPAASATDASSAASVGASATASAESATTAASASTSSVKNAAATGTKASAESK